MKKRNICCLVLTIVLCHSLSSPAFAYATGKVGEYTVISTSAAGYTAIIDENGSLWMWGENEDGQLGNGTSEDSVDPVKVLDNVVSVSCGGKLTAAIKTDGSLWMWGWNHSGQLGNGTTTSSNVPIKVLDNIAAVSCGGAETAAIDENGFLWMWGSNEYGQLGNGTTIHSNVPVKVMESVTAVSCGSSVAAIKSDGSLWMWGSNYDGQLGNGGTGNAKDKWDNIIQTVPIKVLNNVVAVSCGSVTTAAIKADGSLWMWGRNEFGQLGNGATTRSDVKTPIKVLDNVAFVNSGGGSTAAIKTDGSLWMWGRNSYGNLGNGTTANSNVPIKILDNVAAVDCSYYNTAAIKTDGSLWTWGGNSHGQLGRGFKGKDSNIPTKVMDNITFTASVSTPATPSSTEYIYNVSDSGENVTLDISRLEAIIDSTSATIAVQAQAQSMTTEQKVSATGVDLATLYAETAVSRAASKAVSGSEIVINKAAVTDLEAVATQTSSAVETALVNGGVTTARLVSSTVTLTTDETGEITIKIDPDILTTQVDKIRVETPTYAITLKVADLKEDLTESLTITAQDIGSGFAAGNQSKKTTVKVNLPKGKTSNPVTLSLPTDSSDTTYQAVVKTDGSATSSKYNPATTTMDGKVNTSGSYTVQTNQKDFTDIANKSAEMQKAIRYLASKGIINGTSATEFSPDGSINRAEIAALLVRALGKLDNSATNSFTDVKSSDWYYATAGSSQKCGLIKGYTDNTFRGTTPIIKDQILAVAARVLKNEMGYKEPSNPASYLAKYSDTVTAWAQPEVALATKENLVVYRYDGTFKGESNMTRGDAAIIIYRLFQKIW